MARQGPKFLTFRHKIRIPGITELPLSGAGMRIGLFGGSFNPIHEGHHLVIEETLRRLELDAVWVLVTPGNPLKNHSELAPLADRVTAARLLLGNPRIRVTGFEASQGFTYSWQTIRFLTRTMPTGALSGSWGPTIWLISTAGNAGAISRPWCPWPSMSAPAPAAARRSPRPPLRCRAGAWMRMMRRSWPARHPPPGSICMVGNRRCPLPQSGQGGNTKGQSDAAILRNCCRTRILRLCDRRHHNRNRQLAVSKTPAHSNQQPRMLTPRMTHALAWAEGHC